MSWLCLEVAYSLKLGGQLEYASSAEAFQWKCIPLKATRKRDVGMCIGAEGQELVTSIMSSVLIPSREWFIGIK